MGINPYKLLDTVTLIIPSPPLSASASFMAAVIVESPQGISANKK
jgi:hypothetical protein